MEKRAIIDIGSNTIQLMLAECDGVHIRPYLQQIRASRLGARTPDGCLAPERVAATLAILEEYRELIARENVAAVRLVATSAVRDAANQADFLAAVERTFGWRVAVLSGSEEALMSFQGAAGLALAAGEQQLMLIDIGGGSTEVIRHYQGKLKVLSADVGALRARQNGWHEVEIARRLAAVVQPEAGDRGAFVLGVGGTLTTAAGLLLGLTRFDRASIEGYRLPKLRLEELIARLAPLSLAERCAFSPLLAERGEIILEGFYILRTLMNWFEVQELTVTCGGVMDGCLLSWLREA